MEPGLNGYDPTQPTDTEQEAVISPVEKGASWLRDQATNLKETVMSVVSNEGVELGRDDITIKKVAGALALAAGMYVGHGLAQDQNLLATLTSLYFAQAGAKMVIEQSGLVRAWREHAKKEKEGEGEDESER